MSDGELGRRYKTQTSRPMASAAPPAGPYRCHSWAVAATDFQVLRQLPGAGSFTLRGEILGDGPPVVLLHGRSATRRNVVQGSRALVKRGYRLISYDARGHGASQPAPSYEYADLVGDLEAVLDHLELGSVALVGSSMGAATAMAF